MSTAAWLGRAHVCLQNSQAWCLPTLQLTATRTHPAALGGHGNGINVNLFQEMGKQQICSAQIKSGSFVCTPLSFHRTMAHATIRRQANIVWASEIAERVTPWRGLTAGNSLLPHASTFLVTVFGHVQDTPLCSKIQHQKSGCVLSLGMSSLQIASVGPWKLMTEGLVRWVASNKCAFPRLNTVGALAVLQNTYSYQTLSLS